MVAVCGLGSQLCNVRVERRRHQCRNVLDSDVDRIQDVFYEKRWKLK